VLTPRVIGLPWPLESSGPDWFIEKLCPPMRPLDVPRTKSRLHRPRDSLPADPTPRLTARAAKPLPLGAAWGSFIAPRRQGATP
jgi:hypothetical protein